MNEKTKERSKKLQEMGLIFDGSSFIYEDINFHWTDLLCMTDEDFEKAPQGALKRKKIINKNKNDNCKNDLHDIQIKADGRCHWCGSQNSRMSINLDSLSLSVSHRPDILNPNKCKNRYEIQHFDYEDGGRTWHVYDTVERYHIHTASREHLKDDKSVPDSCKKICDALNNF